MSNKLLPCPFCNGEAKIRTTYVELKTKNVPIHSYVSCTKCFAEGTKFTYRDTKRTGVDPIKAAVEAWNRRVPVKDEYEVYGKWD